MDVQWLERGVALLTRHPFLLLAGSLAAAGVALQVDGVLATALPATFSRNALQTSNAACGIAALVLACFAGHAAWFRGRHGDALSVAQSAPLPDQPWQEGCDRAPIGPLYLRSVRLSAGIFGTAVSVLLARTPLIEVGLAVLAASMLTALAATSLLIYGRVTMKYPRATPGA